MNRILLVGAFSEIVELCNREKIEIVGIIDNNIAIGSTYMNIPVIGCDDDAQELCQKYGEIPFVITSDSPKVRKRLFDQYSSIGYLAGNIISSKAYLSPSTYIGIGVVIQDGVYISSDAVIGNSVKLNVACTIMHNSTICDFSTVAPKAMTLGYVSIGEGSYLGANSTILPYVSIGDNVIVGAGAIVTKNISDNKIVKGIPAK